MKLYILSFGLQQPRVLIKLMPIIAIESLEAIYHSHSSYSIPIDVKNTPDRRQS